MTLNKSNKITVAALQCALPGDRLKNINNVVELIRRAAGAGAQIILPPELFEGPYFCKTQSEEFFSWAHPIEGHPTISKMQELAKELNVVIPVSFFEKDGPNYFNSVAIVDADGSLLGVYRKSHIPDGPGYSEKYYFRPGNTGFKVWKTKYATIGVGICWDQWFPECARTMSLMGAQILFYPTAIGSEPHDPNLDTKDPWQRVMMGHAVANAIPVVAANRIGNENGQVFYGSSFICDQRGTKLAEFGKEESGILVHNFDLDEINIYRSAFGFFRDRRPELYSELIK